LELEFFAQGIRTGLRSGNLFFCSFRAAAAGIFAGSFAAHFCPISATLSAQTWRKNIHYKRSAHCGAICGLCWQLKGFFWKNRNFGSFHAGSRTADIVVLCPIHARVYGSDLWVDCFVQAPQQQQQQQLPQPSPEGLAQLAAMGFDEMRAAQALQAAGNDVNDAIALLV